MAGGVIQLAARGPQDMFLTENPQITFFKVVYRRHTNFSTEQVPVTFTTKADFGQKVSCHLQRNGDLIQSIYVVINLPQVTQLNNDDGSINNLFRFAWIRKIGYGIIKEVEVEIGGQSIDKHYGEWLNIWAEIAGKRGSDVNKMIGNVPDLYNMTYSKSEYKLYIPLRFWFCTAAGMALPILALQYGDVKINLELSDLSACYVISPTHYIELENDLVNFQQDEYLTQTIDSNTVAIGRYASFDPITKRLYYTRITTNMFQVINNTNFYSSKYTDNDRATMINSYSITGNKSKYSACPVINTESTLIYSVAYSTNGYSTLGLKDCFLLVGYIYLDEEERLKFYKAKHEYIIEQLIYTGEQSLDGVNRNVRLGLSNPCKLMAWTTHLTYLSTTYNNDIFNYTDSPLYENDEQVGESIIREAMIVFNGHARMAMRDEIYYNCVQPWQYFRYNPPKGINIYSFGIVPDRLQPSGACNMSKIDNIELQLKLSNEITTSNQVKFKGYGLVYNVLRIISGVGGVVFVN